MPQRGRRKPNQVRQPRDDLQRIAGIGPALAQRLYHAGILTYQDLAGRTSEELVAILAGTGRVSPERIHDWITRARQLAGPLPEPTEPPEPPEPPEPSQHYASFHIELLVDVDNSVRRTKVHDHQADTDDIWPGWDEDRLLALLRERVPPTAAPKPPDTADLQPLPTPPATQPAATVPSTSTSQPPSSTPSISLPPSSLHIEELVAIRDGQRDHLRRPDEQTSVRLTLRIYPNDIRPTARFDFTANIAARSKLGDNYRHLLGTTQGAIRVNDPLSIELTGPPLPPGLYRLIATVAVYPADHTGEAQRLFSRDASGDLIQVGSVATTQTAPAEGL